MWRGGGLENSVTLAQVKVEAAEGAESLILFYLFFFRRGGETTLTLSIGFKLGPEEQVLRPGSSAMTINCRKLHKKQNDGGGNITVTVEAAEDAE